MTATLRSQHHRSKLRHEGAKRVEVTLTPQEIAYLSRAGWMDGGRTLNVALKAVLAEVMAQQ